MVSRLVEQKGIDLHRGGRRSCSALDATWVFVGTGEPRFETVLRDLAARYPTRVGVHIGFDEPLAHLVEAGADMFLMPSRFEPCGLNQMYSLRYGTVPIVHAVGGLDDTIQPYTARAQHANGFKFRRAPASAGADGASGGAAVSATRRVAAARCGKACQRPLVGDVRQGICQSVQTGTRDRRRSEAAL